MRWLKLTGALLLAALAVQGPGQDSARAQGEPIKLAVLTSFTTELAMTGVHVANGAQMAADEINEKGGIRGRKIELVKADTANSNTVAVNALHKVLAEKPVAIVGPVWGTQNLAMSPIIRKEGVPLIYSSGTVKVSKQGNPWLFGVHPSDEIAAKAIAKFAVERLGKKRIAIEYINNEYGIGSAAVVVETLKGYGLKPVAQESHASTDKDISAQLLKLKAANPDVIIVWAFPADAAVIMRQVRQLGIKGPFLGATAPVLPATLNLVSAADAEGWYGEVAAWVTDNPDPKIRAWVERYKKKFNLEPDAFDAIYSDGVKMLATAIENALDRGARTPSAMREEVRKAMAATHYQGIDTVYAYDREGRGPHAFGMVQVQKDKRLKLIEWVRVEP